ncbi:MAG TPA: carboxypeptidase-like regulatory domain-containing protein [Thermoguttaceae bacterium]|nr:carboxypeptidase-like regulatory domain-containing protein [Thermoguttaceae bacterium]
MHPFTALLVALIFSAASFGFVPPCRRCVSGSTMTDGDGRYALRIAAGCISDFTMARVEDRPPAGAAAVKQAAKTLDEIAAAKWTAYEIHQVKQRMASQLAKRLEARDYEAAAELFLPGLKETLPPAKLRTILREIEARYGTAEVDECGDMQRFGDQRFRSIRIIMRRAQLRCHLAQNDQGQIDGLWIADDVEQDNHQPPEAFPKGGYRFGAAIERVAGADSRIEVHVSGLDGKPIATSTVAIWMAIDKDAPRQPDDWSDAVTDRIWRLVAGEYVGDKGYVAQRLLKGTYRVAAYTSRAHGDSFRGTPCGMSDEVTLDETNPNAVVTVRARKGPTVSIRLVDAASGKPLDGSSAWLKNIDNGFGPGEKYFCDGKDGLFTIDHLPPGIYRLYAGRWASRPEVLQYRPIDDPVTVTVVEGQDQTLTIRLQGKPLEPKEIETRWPWVATGTVTDENGRPMEGVEIWAHCGWGSLHRTGTTKTGKDGRYTLRFAPGIISFSNDGKPPINLQAAIIAPLKNGFTEKNLYRHGGLYAANWTPQKSEAGEHIDPAKVIVPGKPYRLDFVMIRAVTIEGRAVDEQGKPLADWNAGLGGDVGPPGGAVVRGTKTDAKGRFRIGQVPPGFDWRLGVGQQKPLEKKGRSRPIRFSVGGTYRVKLRLTSIKDSEWNVLKIVNVTSPDGKNVTVEVVGEKGGGEKGLSRVEDVKFGGRPAVTGQFGEIILRAIDIDTGRGLPGATFGRENSIGEERGNRIGQSDNKGYFRFKAQARRP